MAVPDALIMAYADGELEGPLAARVRDAIESDPSVRDKYEIYDGSRKLLAGVFDDVLSESIPDRLKQTCAPGRLGQPPSHRSTRASKPGFAPVPFAPERTDQ